MRAFLSLEASSEVLGSWQSWIAFFETQSDAAAASGGGVLRCCAELHDASGAPGGLRSNPKRMPSPFAERNPAPLVLSL